MTAVNNVEVEQQGTVTIFGCGGAGIGISKYFEQERGKNSAGFAKVSPAYMDTSRASNFDVPEDFFYHLEGLEGSGGVKAENGALIIKHTKEILQRFPAGELTIVVSSTTGGSGSVMGPSIVSELLAQGKAVIAFHVGGDDSLQYINNTISTLASYETVAELREMPVVLQYYHNGEDGTIEQVDLLIHQAISSLIALFSRQNKNLDSRDLSNWLNFSKKGVTSYAPQVAVLTIQPQKLDIEDRGLISLVTLNHDLNDTRVDQPVEYQRVGVPRFFDKETTNMRYPMHFAITDGFVDMVLKRLRAKKKDYVEKANARVVRNKLTTGKENVQSNGLSFD